MKNAIVVTTINPPTEALGRLAKIPGWRLIVVGDAKTNGDWALEGAEFIPFCKQHEPFGLSLPINSYSRKMLGYLEAWRGGAEWVLDTDDDTSLIYGPSGGFPGHGGCHRPYGPLNLNRMLPYLAHLSGWVNSFDVYRTFIEPAWPRGFPLEHVNDRRPTVYKHGKAICPVRQCMVNGDADVDAVQRLTRRPYVHEFNSDLSFAVASDCYCPINSQATYWHRSAAPLMYLPTTCTMRATDIIRGYVAQRCMREQGWNLALEPAHFVQKRNAHDLMDDFRQEMPIYLHVKEMAAVLDKIDMVGNLAADLKAAYCALIGAFPSVIDLYKEHATFPLWLKEIKNVE